MYIFDCNVLELHCLVFFLARHYTLFFIFYVSYILVIYFEAHTCPKKIEDVTSTDTGC